MAMLQSAADSRKERAMTDIVTHTDRIATIGMDLGKRSFHLIGMDARGKVIMRQQLSRGRLERHMANLPYSQNGCHVVARKKLALWRAGDTGDKLLTLPP
jgi:hypothetical protein